jgi:hypothetical protein
LVIVTVEFPVSVHPLVAEVPVMVGFADTVMLAVLLEERLVVPQKLVISVTVIVDAPAVVSPVAVNVPVPAVETVKVAVNAICDGDEVLYFTVYEPTDRSAAVEFVSVTVDVPGLVHASVADVPVIDPNVVSTEIFAVLFELNVLEHEPPCTTIDVTVIVDAPSVVNPVAEKVPLPAVLTVMVAVFPV